MHRWKRSEQSLTNQGTVGGGPREERKDQEEWGGKGEGNEVRYTESHRIRGLHLLQFVHEPPASSYHLHPAGRGPAL